MARTPAHMLPNPEDCPTVPVWPTAAKALGIGRNTAYEAVAAGQIPSIRLGNRVVVPTAALRRMLELDEQTASVAS